MASSSTDTSSDKQNRPLKRRPYNNIKRLATKTGPEAHTRVNLQRTNLPTNWKQFVDQQVDSKSKGLSKQFPKSITQPSTSQNDASNANSEIDMAPHPNHPTSEVTGATGRCVAIDCEMVGIGDGGRDNMLARVSLVDENGAVVYDTFVKPQQHVIDYRTAVSGVRPHDMEAGRDFRDVQQDVFNIIKGKLLIGHALRNDLKVLFLSHPKKLIRDTSKYKKFREEASGRTPSLRFLAQQVLGIEIQHGEHSSIEDARATMYLYMKYKNNWEAEIRSRHYKKK